MLQLYGTVYSIIIGICYRCVEPEQRATVHGCSLRFGDTKMVMDPFEILFIRFNVESGVVALEIPRFAIFEQNQLPVFLTDPITTVWHIIGRLNRCIHCSVTSHDFRKLANMQHIVSEF